SSNYGRKEGREEGGTHRQLRLHHWSSYFRLGLRLRRGIYIYKENNEMTRGKQKIEAQKRNAEKNQKSKGSQIEARAVGLKVTCPICKVQLANQNQLVDHYASKHPKEKPPTESN
ncbi:hypothetical protein CR513_03040, partial [Mucuna pruriens]